MPFAPALDRLDTDRLILRPRRTDEAAIYRQLWVERDARTPPRRRIDPEGRPTRRISRTTSARSVTGAGPDCSRSS